MWRRTYVCTSIFATIGSRWQQLNECKIIQHEFSGLVIMKNWGHFRFVVCVIFNKVGQIPELVGYSRLSGGLLIFWMIYLVGIICIAKIQRLVELFVELCVSQIFVRYAVNKSEWVDKMFELNTSNYSK